MSKNKASLDYIVIDTETTGLDVDDDEILQLSIIDNNNDVLLDKYFKPVLKENWSEAEEIHGISKNDVKNKKHIYATAPKIQEILNKTDKIVCYNADFDLGFLRRIGLDLSHIIKIDDVMLMFADIYGEWNDYFCDYKWQKLVTCANYYDYDWNTSKAHNSLADCFATNYCYRKIIGE